MSKKFSLKDWDIKELLERNRKQLYLLATGLLAYFSPMHPLVNIVGAPIVYMGFQTLDFYIRKQD